MSDNIRDAWETPKQLFDVLDREFGFDIDVACTQFNRKCGIGLEVDLDRDAMQHEWFPNHCSPVAWCNPPYSNPKPWVQRAIDETNETPGSVAVMLLNHDASTGWYKLALEHASEIRIMTGKRVQFVAPDGIKASSNAKAQCVIVFRKKQHNAPCHLWHWDWMASIQNKKKD